MNFAQGLSFALIGGAIIAFASGRFRYDLVSLVALLIAVLSGDVKPKDAFTGFTSDVVVIIACALVVSAAIARSGAIEMLVRPLFSRLKRLRYQVPVLAGTTAIFSMLTKNVGALATLMPIAIRMGRTKGSSVTALLMPMSFMSLLGGLVTLVGTSTNIIVSQVREQITGKPFAMFDFAPVGLSLTALGLIVVSLAWPVLPRQRTSRTALGETNAAAPYSSEVRIPEKWPETLATVSDLALAKGDVKLTAVIDAKGKRRPALPDYKLTPGITLVLEGDDAALGALFARLPLGKVEEAEKPKKEEASEETRTIEAVIQPQSLLVGRSAAQISLQHLYGVKLLAVGRRGERISERMAAVHLRAGDVLVLQSGEAAVSEALQSLNLLPLAERSVTIGDRRWRFLPLLILAVAIGLVVANAITIAVAFFGAAVMVVVTGSLSMREAYDSLEPEVLVLIGALTPLSEAVQHSGGADLVAHAIGNLLSGAPPMLILGGLMITAMAAAPFLHNAPTVLVLAPIGAALAQQLKLGPDAFLMAVATGAGCDFLTPIGHQCNTLVRGPGGYRFGDYWRLGLPLSIVVIVFGTPLIWWLWSSH